MSGINGVIAAAVTPRRRDGHQADLGAALDLIDSLSGHGVDGIALFGSTGEFVHYDLEDRLRLVQLVIKRSRAPVLVNVSHSMLDGALLLGRAAASQGAAAVLLMPPYFFPYDPEEVEAFCLSFAREMAGAVPILLYNIPAFTSRIPVETAEALLATGLFAGIKDSSGRLDYFRRMRTLRSRGGFVLLVGNDKVFTKARKAGADGVISGVACAVPELMVGLDRAITAGRAPEVELLEARLQEFLSRIDRFPTPVGIREAASARGLKTGPASVPLGARKERELAEFREWFLGWLPAVCEEVVHA